MKTTLVVAAFCLFLLSLRAPAFCQFGAPEGSADPLAGTYNFDTTGTAQLGAQTGGDDTCQATGSVGASLWKGTIVFKNGEIEPGPTASYSFLSMGGTECTFGFSITGTYTVQDEGNGAFQASGTMSLQGNANVDSLQVACGEQFKILNVPFTVDGVTSQNSYAISTSGAESGSNYIEGHGRLVLCVAPILNFVTSGKAVKVNP